MRILVLILLSIQTSLALGQDKYVEVIPQNSSGGFSLIEKNAMYPGGINGIDKLFSDNIKYPEKAIKKGIEGVVIISFLVRVDGKVDEIQVIKSVHASVDKESIRVARLMEKWQPAIQRGKKVKQRYTYEVEFKLD